MREYKEDCVHYNSITSECNIHHEDCEECNLYHRKMKWNQPTPIDPRKLSGLDMKVWEGDDDEL